MDLKGINKPLGRVEGVLGKPATSPQRDASAVGGADSVELSSEAKEVLSGYEAVRALAASPAPVRQERVLEVQGRIADGYYNQSSVRRAIVAKLADAFLGLSPRLA